MFQQDAKPQGTRPDWLRLQVEQHSLRQYLTTLRKRAWVVVLVVLVTTGAAVAYVANTDEVYEAEADVLVTPVPSDDRLLRGLGLISASSDPEREIETVARLLTARNVEGRAERENPELDNPDIEVSAEPVAESNIVSVIAQAPTRRLASDAANAYAEAAVEIRTERFQEQLEQAIITLENQIRRAARAGAPVPVGELARLEALRDDPDPTVRLEVRAKTPDSPVWPRPALSIAVGVLVGLILGTGAIFIWQLLDPTLRREEELKDLFNLPILARIPMERRRRWWSRGALSPAELSPQATEAYRALRFAMIAVRQESGGRGSIFVTGPSPSEGKTTTCLNLAASLAQMDQSVILLEADLRRPAVARATGIRPPENGVAGVLLGQVDLEQALVPAPQFSENLRVLLADEEGEWLADQLSLPAARRLVAEAQKLADFVVIDSPPVIDVTDTLPLAKEADDVLLVIRMGKSRLDDLEELGELLAQQGITPLGIVLVGAARARGSYYYYGGRKSRSKKRDIPPAAEEPRASDDDTPDPPNDEDASRTESEAREGSPSPGH